MGRDIRSALAGLRRSPLFTTLAIAILGVGMGANAVVFCVVDQLVLRPLPFGERAERLVTLHAVHPTRTADLDDAALSMADVRELRAATIMFDGIEGFLPRDVSLVGPDDAERVSVASITPGLFALLGVQPWMGRDFRDADGAEPGFEGVVLISHGLWQRRFAADPTVVGREARVNGRSLTIIGVMPAGFRFPESQDLWLPYAAPAHAPRDRRTLTTLALLRTPDGLRPAQDDLDRQAARLAAAYPDSHDGWTFLARPMRQLFVQSRTSRSVAVMLGAVGLVLLVACTNVASLSVARGLGRARELTVRAALGASRARLLRLLLAESLVLSIAGGILAVIVALWGLDALRALVPEPPPFWVRLSLDGRVLGYLALLVGVVTIACGWLPAWRATRVDLVAGLHDGGRTFTVARAATLQSGLLVGQVAVSLALLVAAGLLSRSAGRLATTDTGFEATPLLSLRVYIAGDAYDDVRAREGIVARLLDRLRAVPGVTDAAVTGAIPADDGGVPVDVIPAGADPQFHALAAQVIPATGSLAATLGVGLVEGRSFTSAEERDPGASVVLVNRSLANRLWPDGSAVDRLLALRLDEGVQRFRVVGVMPDIVYEELGEQSDMSRLTVYQPYVNRAWRRVAVIVRASGRPDGLVPAIRRVLHDTDPLFAPFDVQTMVQRRHTTQWGERFLAQVFSLFAAVAVGLAGLGAYGLMSAAVLSRTREVGIRLVLGAPRRSVRRLLLRRGLTPVAIGIAVGLPVAAVVAALLRGLLFDVSPFSAGAWLIALATSIAAAAIACDIPARRASRLDPAAALRDD